MGAVEAVQLAAVLLAEQERSAVRGVDVELRAVAVAQVGDLGQWVDLPGVGGPGARRDEARARQIGEGLVECGQIQDARGRGYGHRLGQAEQPGGAVQ